MPAPVLGTVGAELLGQTEPLAADDTANGYVFAHLCEAIGRMWQDVDDLIRDDGIGVGPGWSALVDVERCPDDALPWLSQIGGTRLVTGATGDENRTQISDVSAQKRGRPETIKAAARRHLTGTKTVYLSERAGSAYRVEMATLDSETPDEAQTQRDIEAALPIGDVLEYGAIVGGDYETLRDTHSDYQDVKDTFTDYDDVRTDPSQQ